MGCQRQEPRKFSQTLRIAYAKVLGLKGVWPVARMQKARGRLRGGKAGEGNGSSMGQGLEHKFSVSVFIPRTVGRKPLEDFEKSDLITYVIVKVPDQLLVPPPPPPRRFWG